MAKINIVDLHVKYQLKTNAVHALKGVSFQLRDGDHVGVIGRNGSGKSTLLKVLSKVIPQSSGVVDIEGERLSLLGRHSGLIPRASLLENAKIKAYSLGLNYSEAEAFAKKSISVANLEEKKDAPLGSLSTGMAGRFNIAINSVLVREVAIMDEWVSTLDITGSNEGGMLDKVSKQAKIFVFASHNEALIRSLCNKVILLDMGRLLYFGRDVDAAFKQLAELPNKKEN